MTVLVDDETILDIRPRSRAVPSALPVPIPACGPISRSVVDLLSGGRRDDQPVDASKGPSGHPHDADLHTALWLLSSARTVGFDGVDPDRAVSLRARTLHWFLEQALDEQLRRLVPRPDPSRLHARLARIDGAPPADLPGRARALAQLTAHVEAPLVPVLADALVGDAGRTSAPALPAGAPSCALARANAMWSFARDRRRRGAAIGMLCLGAGAGIESAGILRSLEQATPWLVADAAWGAEVDLHLARCAARCSAGPAGPR